MDSASRILECFEKALSPTLLFICLTHKYRNAVLWLAVSTPFKSGISSRTPRSLQVKPFKDKWVLLKVLCSLLKDFNNHQEDLSISHRLKQIIKWYLWHFRDHTMTFLWPASGPLLAKHLYSPKVCFRNLPGYFDKLLRKVLHTPGPQRSLKGPSQPDNKPNNCSPSLTIWFKTNLILEAQGSSQLTRTIIFTVFNILYSSRIFCDISKVRLTFQPPTVTWNTGGGLKRQWLRFSISDRR